MTSLFCCSNIEPFRPQSLSHEPKFQVFMKWAAFPGASSLEDRVGDEDVFSLNEPLYAVQLVRQVNYGPLESKRYFIVVKENDEPFLEVSERELIKANFQKLNSWVLPLASKMELLAAKTEPRYKNFKCTEHNKFFEVNLYQKDPINTHHWRANLARPASEIDL
jgi:hypothetical protein